MFVSGYYATVSDKEMPLAMWHYLQQHTYPASCLSWWLLVD